MSEEEKFYDQLLRKIFFDPLPKMLTEKQTLNILHNRLSWNAGRSGKCYYENCDKNAIQSHVFSKGILDNLITDDNPLFILARRARDTNYFKKTGSTKAIRFPGFCEEHEALFKDFEISKTLSKNSDYLLQLYRAACYEDHMLHVYINNYKKTIEAFNSQYINNANDYLKRLNLNSRITKIKDEYSSNANKFLQKKKHELEQRRKKLRAFIKRIYSDIRMEIPLICYWFIPT